jgi:hypothetical protein
MTPKNNILPGHSLPNEGRIVDGPYLSSGIGVSVCTCGTPSPLLPNAAQRKVWHRDHKDDVRAGGDGIVWEGVN